MIRIRTILAVLLAAIPPVFLGCGHAVVAGGGAGTEPIGTGVGDRKIASMSLVDARFEQSPAFIVNLNYKSRDHLVQAGIIGKPIEKYYQKLQGLEAAFDRDYAGNVTRADPADVDEQVKTLSDYFSEAILSSRIKSVALMDFVYTKGPAGEAVINTIGRFFPQEITVNLLTAGGDRFEIVERESIEKVLTEQKLQLSDMVEGATAVGLGKVSGVQALLVGSVTRLADDIKLFAKLINVESAKVLGGKSVRIKVDPDIKALLGENLASSPKSKSLTDNEELLLNTLAYLYEVKISFSGGPPMPLYLHDGQLYTEAGLGRPYEVIIHNKSDKDIGVSLSIDGVNTIDRKITKPSSGAKWYVRKGAKARIEGWYVDEKAVEKFLFVEGSKSLAASLGYTKEIGRLTAAFYAVKSPGD